MHNLLNCLKIQLIELCDYFENYDYLNCMKIVKTLNNQLIKFSGDYEYYKSSDNFKDYEYLKNYESCENYESLNNSEDSEFFIAR